MRPFDLDTTTQNQSPEYVPVTTVLVLCAMAHQRDVTVVREPFEKAQGELLSVILDALTAGIDRAVHKHFGTIVGSKLGPGDPTRLTGSQKSLTRSKTWHPHVVSIDGHCTAAKASGEYPKAIGLSIDRTPHGFRLKHLFSIFRRQPNK